MLVINAQPARDNVIDTLNSVWFDLLLLSAEIWGRVDSFCVGLEWPQTSLCEMWRLLLDTRVLLQVSQLAHVNWLIPRLFKWKTDIEYYFEQQSCLLCSFPLVCLVTPLIVLLCFTFTLLFAAALSGCTLLLRHLSDVCHLPGLLSLRVLLSPSTGSICMRYVKMTQL